MNSKEITELEKNMLKIEEQREREKEEKLVDLIIEMIVSSTLKEYYETRHQVPQVQPTRTK
ncbi:hypothetical protein [Parapedobacter sp. 10938]|uniref:hypothetical protein n=1 Tax=Parapedobacter flavus TaxID=3110225 RepID=UPI002DB9A24E|nr:hypothetical protein [Parapedobacter sp. 10938]MEC3880202.1 hypothetical protein [Parapedobacter sp. 10938]